MAMQENPGEVHIGRLIGSLTGAGFGVRLHPDPFASREHSLQQAGYDPVSAVDPYFVSLRPRRNFFWLQILDSHHRVVSGCSGRIFRAPWWRGGIGRMIARQEIFGPPDEQLYSPPVRIDDPDQLLRRIHGRIGYLGAGFTEPRHRARGLMTIAVQLAQAWMVHRFRVGHVVAFVRPQHGALALSGSGYRFKRLVPTATEYCAGSGMPERFQFVHATAGEIAAHWASCEVPAPAAEEQLVLADFMMGPSHWPSRRAA